MTEQWQELKETIIEMRDNDGSGTQQEVCKFLAKYMETLEKQMREPRWIPVSERLPEVDGKYFITVKGVDTNYIEIRSFANSLYKIDKFDFSGKKGHGWYFYDYDYGIHGYIEETNVIAWMPFPEPYKEREANDE